LFDIDSKNFRKIFIFKGAKEMGANPPLCGMKISVKD